MAVSYEVVSTESNGAIFEGELDGVQQTVISVTVKVGVVDNAYKGFFNLDKITVNYPSSYNQGQIDAQVASEAAAYVTATYPNIP